MSPGWEPGNLAGKSKHMVNFPKARDVAGGAMRDKVMGEGAYASAMPSPGAALRWKRGHNSF